MTRNELKEFITNFYQAWNQRDEQKIPSFYHEDVKAHADFKSITLQDMFNRLEFSKRAFSQSNYNLKDIIIDEEEGRIAVRMHQNHLLRNGTGARECEAIMLYKVDNFKITEIWMSFYPNVDYTDNSI